MTPEKRDELERRLDKYRDAVAKGWKGGPLPEPEATPAPQFGPVSPRVTF